MKIIVLQQGILIHQEKKNNFNPDKTYFYNTVTNRVNRVHTTSCMYMQKLFLFDDIDVIVYELDAVWARSMLTITRVSRFKEYVRAIIRGTPISARHTGYEDIVLVSGPGATITARIWGGEEDGVVNPFGEETEGG